MLKIRGKNDRTKFILKDEDEEPIPIDEFILQEEEDKKDKKTKKTEEE